MNERIAALEAEARHHVEVAKRGSDRIAKGWSDTAAAVARAKTDILRGSK